MKLIYSNFESVNLKIWKDQPFNIDYNGQDLEVYKFYDVLTLIKMLKIFKSDLYSHDIEILKKWYYLLWLYTELENDVIEHGKICYIQNELYDFIYFLSNFLNDDFEFIAWSWKKQTITINYIGDKLKKVKERSLLFIEINTRWEIWKKWMYTINILGKFENFLKKIWQLKIYEEYEKMLKKMSPYCLTRVDFYFDFNIPENYTMLKLSNKFSVLNMAKKVPYGLNNRIIWKKQHIGEDSTIYYKHEKQKTWWKRKNRLYNKYVDNMDKWKWELYEYNNPLLRRFETELKSAFIAKKRDSYKVNNCLDLINKLYSWVVNSKKNMVITKKVLTYDESGREIYENRRELIKWKYNYSLPFENITRGQFDQEEVKRWVRVNKDHERNKVIESIYNNDLDLDTLKKLVNEKEKWLFKFKRKELKVKKNNDKIKNMWESINIKTNL